MAKRFSNMISRAIERDQAARQNDDAATDAVERRDTYDDKHAAAELPQARILTMPNRRLPFVAAETDQTDKTVENSRTQIEAPPSQITPENWKWSEPPRLIPQNDQRRSGANELTATPNAAREPEIIEASSAALTVTNTDAATVTNNNHLSTNGAKTGGAHALAVFGASPYGLQSRPVFRTVTINSERVEPHLVAITDPRSSQSEEFRNLRTRILHASQTQKLQAITIASGSPGEGKSTVALNLAWLLAQTDGINALIIDSDLRLPCLADYLDVSADCGLSEVFSGEAKLEDAILRLEPSGLHLLPGGASRSDVAEMLSGNKFRNILEQTRKLFDYIIVDAPSLGIFTDAAVLINQTDAALLVVRAGKTKFGVTNRLLETLPRERMFGVVLNGSDEGLSNDTHYDHYYNVEKKRLSE